MNIILVSGATARARTLTPRLAALDGRRLRPPRAVPRRSRCCSTSSRCATPRRSSIRWLQAIVLADQRRGSAEDAGGRPGPPERDGGQAGRAAGADAAARRPGRAPGQARRAEAAGIAGRCSRATTPGRGGPAPSLPSRRSRVAEFTAMLGAAGAAGRRALRPARRARGAAGAGFGQPQVPADACADRRRLVFVELRLAHRSVHRTAESSTKASIFRPSVGTPIVAAASGKVIFADVHPAVW